MGSSGCERARISHKKGKKATVIGELRQDRWKAQDGSNRSKLKVVGQMIRFDGLPGKKERDAA
ncbi:single-strand binding domain protein [Leptospira kirschneri str. H2]|nr:single-strand binding domain protein [Leptospira kirschneri str. H2]